MKKILALLLALTTFALMFSGCAKLGKKDGAVIDVYMGTKVLNLDPAIAYTDENAVKILSLIFEGLMKINENGKLDKALCKKYEIYTDERTGATKMRVVINTTYWSDSSLVQTNDIVYAWKRILDPEFNSAAASLLYAVKGARAAKLGQISIDDIGLCALSKNILDIEFEENANIDEFLYNLASPALVPLRENKVSLYTDTWSRKSTDLSTNGPFRVRKFSQSPTEELILERSYYYYLAQSFTDETHKEYIDSTDKYVKPYRIIVHFAEPLDKNIVYSSGDTDIVTMFKNNKLFYISGLTNAALGNFKKSQIDTNDLASTYSYYFNTAKTMFSDARVRYALSIALDRTAIANLVGCGVSAATGLVPSMIFNTKKGTSFRDKGGDILTAAGNIEEARALLTEAGIDPKKTDTIYLYFRTDDTNDSYYSAQMGYVSKEKAIAQYTETVWESLGFNIVLKGVNSTEYEAVYNNGTFDVIGLDYQALSSYAFYMLSPFAKSFSGRVQLVSEGDEIYYKNVSHMTGYYNADYDALIEAAYTAADEKEKALLLHQAEELLLNDAPVVPLVFNAECYVVSSELSKISTNYFGAKIFTKTRLADWQSYLETES